MPLNVLDPAQLKRIESVHRGFLYQHLFAVWCLLRATHLKLRRVVVESDEDVELASASDCCYIQVKFRTKLLGVTDIRGALKRFDLLRQTHREGLRSGTPAFVIATNSTPNSSLAKRLASPDWPADVSVQWPAASRRADLLPSPPADLSAAFARCCEHAAALPFASLAPETLVWKLAGLVMLAATGTPPFVDHGFQAPDLPKLFEQVLARLQEFPAPPRGYRVQTNEPALIGGAPIRMITGFSGAGKTAWAAQSAIHSPTDVAYFDVRDIPGAALAASLARELAARALEGSKGARLGEVLFPGAAGSEILQALGRVLAAERRSFTVVLDNVHLPSPADVQALVTSACGVRFVLLLHPGPAAAELAARLQVKPEALAGWDPDTIACEAASLACRADYLTCERLRSLTGGLPLYVQHALSVASTVYGGDVSAFCRALAAQTHVTETAQELILTAFIDRLPSPARDAVTVLSICDIPLQTQALTRFLSAALQIDAASATAQLRSVARSGLAEVFGSDRLKLHDAARLLGESRLRVDPFARRKAFAALREVLSSTLPSGDTRLVLLFLRTLVELRDIKPLVEVATDELFHELGMWPEIRDFLMEAVAAPDTGWNDRFWAMDALVFGDLKSGEDNDALALTRQMMALVDEKGLGLRERMAAGMKQMNILARQKDRAGVLDLIKEMSAVMHRDQTHHRIFRYNAALAYYQIGDRTLAAQEAMRLAHEYYAVLGLTPDMVLGRNPDALQRLLPKRDNVANDAKHLADCLDLYATASPESPGRCLIWTHAMKFYACANAPDSLIRVGQDLVDELVARNDFVGAQIAMESNILPTLRQAKLAGRVLAVRSQYAVVLAYCGNFTAATDEMRRLSAYEDGLSQRDRKELHNQRRLIESIIRNGPPPQLHMPNYLLHKKTPPAEVVTRVGRNAPCPCGSGLKYKRCHGSLF